MSKFTKYNNPYRKPYGKRHRSQHSKAYIEEMKNELYQLVADTETDEERELLIDAFRVSVRP